MKTIMCKIKKNSYPSLKEVKDDFMLMLANAQKYYKAQETQQQESQVNIDAQILEGVHLNQDSS